MTMFRTEFDFTLPVGFVDSDGVVHRDGVIRLATGADEIHPIRDPRVVSNSSYLVCVVLSRVVTQLGSLTSDDVTPKVIESMFMEDLLFLQGLYNDLNHRGGRRSIAAECPHCQHQFEVMEGPPPSGGSRATPSLA